MVDSQNKTKKKKRETEKKEKEKEGGTEVELWGRGTKAQGRVKLGARLACLSDCVLLLFLLLAGICAFLLRWEFLPWSGHIMSRTWWVGDWLCAKYDYRNFARNGRCGGCGEKLLKRRALSQLPDEPSEHQEALHEEWLQAVEAHHDELEREAAVSPA